MAVTDVHALRPRWPAELPEAASTGVSYYPPADELLVWFSGKPVPAVTVPLAAPDYDQVALLVDGDTNEVVGIQVIPLLVGAVRAHPSWATLAWGALAGFDSDETATTAVAAFLADVAGHVALHGADRD